MARMWEQHWRRGNGDVVKTHHINQSDPTAFAYAYNQGQTDSNKWLHGYGNPRQIEVDLAYWRQVSGNGYGKFA